MLTLDGPFKLIPALYYSVCSVSDVGQLLQCTMGDEDPGCVHSGQTSGSCPHYCGGTSPDLQRLVHTLVTPVEPVELNYRKPHVVPF